MSILFYRLTLMGFAGLGAVALIQGVRFGYTSFGAPGPGFFVTWSGIILLAGSLIALLSRVEELTVEFNAQQIYIVISIAVLAILIPVLGMILSVNFYIVFMIWIFGGGRLRSALVCAASMTLIIYVCFEIWLQIPLPAGYLF